MLKRNAEYYGVVCVDGSQGEYMPIADVMAEYGLTRTQVYAMAGKHRWLRTYDDGVAFGVNYNVSDVERSLE